MPLSRTTVEGIPTMAAPKPTGASFDLLSDLADALVNDHTGVSVLNYEATGDGATDDYTAINNALTAASEAGKWLVFPPGTYLIETSIVLTVPVLFLGGILKLAATKSATFNEPYMNPGMGQCFDEQGRLPNAAGGVVVALTSPQCVVSPLDWGADSTGTTRSDIQIQQAVGSVTYAANSDKIGIVEFPSGKYAMEEGIYIGYDWVTYSDAWDNRNGSDTLTCNRHADVAATRPQGRKERVILRGLGVVKFRGAAGGPPNAFNPYLIYYASSGNANGGVILDNLWIEGRSLWRGAYVSGMAYHEVVQNIWFEDTIYVGLDWLECWGSSLRNIFFKNCRGFQLRAVQANTCNCQSISPWAGYGARNEDWPAVDESFVRAGIGITGTPISGAIQIPAEDRAACFIHGNNSTWKTILVEANAMGSPLQATVSGGTTVTEEHHGLEATDPVWVADSSTKKTTVASITNTSTFELTDAANNGSRRLIYRRATGITKANPAVVTCQNHGLIDGNRVRIVDGSGAGMGELDANPGSPATNLTGPWYVVANAGDDTFELNDFNGDGIDTNSNGGADYTNADGSEYLIFGSPLIYVANNGGSLKDVRCEGNIAPQSKIVIADLTKSLTIEGVSVGDNKTASLDSWAVECRDRVQSSSISSITGAGILRAPILFRVTNGMYANGNEVGLSSVVSSSGVAPSEGLMEKVLSGNTLGTFEGNNIAGAWSPILVVNGDTTPSVLGDYNNGQAMLDFFGTRVYGPMLSVPAGYSDIITDFDDGQDGQILSVRFLGGSATIDANANIVTKAAGTADLTPSAGELLQFHNVSGVWYQI